MYIATVLVESVLPELGGQLLYNSHKVQVPPPQILYNCKKE